MPQHVLLARAVALALATPAAPAAPAATPTSGGGGSSAPGTLLWVAIAGLASSLIAGGLVAWSVKQLITPSLNRAGASIADLLLDYLAVLHSRSLRRIRRYQRSVGDYARRHTLGFGAEPISVRDVYVPLARETAGRREDLYEAVREERRSVVTGEAGAGKSMLLKHLDAACRRMLLSLPWHDQLRILRLLPSAHSRSDWQSMPTTKQKRARTWPYIIALGVSVVAYSLCLAFWQEGSIVLGHWTWGARWLAVPAWITLIGGFGPFLVASLMGSGDSDPPGILILGFLLALLFVPYHLLVVLAGTAHWLGWHTTWIAFAVLSVLAGPVIVHAMLRDRRVRNPLRQAIEAAGATSSSTSIITGTVQP